MKLMQNSQKAASIGTTMVEARNESKKPDVRLSMADVRYQNKMSIGGGMHILGERNFDADEEEDKEVEELKMVQELT